MNMSIILTKSQKSALAHFTKYGYKNKKEAINEINDILKNSNIAFSEYLKVIETIKNKARVCIHFHPDRPDPSMKTTIENLYKQGIYKSQFETFISSGAVSPFIGGSRDKWEKKLFGGAYNTLFTKTSERPKYGSLDLMLNADGPSPRFGSCYFVLKPEVSHRCTFTYMDSHQLPKERGTLKEFDFIISALLRDTFHHNNTLGERDITIKELFHHINSNLGESIKNLTDMDPKRNLNNYIEAQIHGNISLKNDIETLVTDPSFIETDIGEKIEQTCNKYSIKLLWHMGFAMKTNDVPYDFRGNEMPKLAEFISINKTINPFLIGFAVMDLYKNPEKWKNWGIEKEIIQKLKLLWHVLVKYGKKHKEIYM